ncbi:MipA/OmpV family protein [Pantoea vagans]|uniref:MipA/OmpV family protein n=1 Tax=Pantoea vagans TaxID=470934 RepID=UPI0009BF6551
MRSRQVRVCESACGLMSRIVPLPWMCRSASSATFSAVRSSACSRAGVVRSNTASRASPAARGIGDYTWLDKHASDSPIVARHNGVSASLALSYTF